MADLCIGKVCAKFVDEVEVWVAELAMHHHKEHKFKQMKLRYKTSFLSNLGVVKEVVPLCSLFIHALSSYLFSLMLMKLSLLFEFVPTRS
jgi:hypothetical protein